MNAASPLTSADRAARIRAEFGLALITAIWGATFVVVKRLVESLDAHQLNFMRFTLAAGAVWLVELAAPRRQASADVARGRDLLQAGAILGVLLFLINEFQTQGLRTTTASKSAFLTGSSIVWTPALTYLLFRRRPTGEVVPASLMGLFGLGLLIWGVGPLGAAATPPVIGDFLTVLCALAIALHLIATRRYSPRFSTTRLTAWQLTAVAAINGAIVLFERRPLAIAQPAAIHAQLVFLALPATALAFWGQTRLQRHTTEERAAVVFLCEPLFGVLFATWLLAERLTGPQWLGAVMILIAMAAPALRLSPNRPAD